MRQIDLNADLGESFGAWRMGDDEGVMPWITSANIACGFHAGDPPTMRKTVALCVRHRVALGAHPSLLDLQGFGRREMKMSPDEIYAQTLYQIGALQAFAHAAGTRLRHVKPHGALYNMAACERALADAIAHAVADFDRRLILVGLAGSALVAAGLGITALPRLALQLAHNDELVTVPLQRPVMSRPIGLVTRAGRSPSPVSRAFMDLLYRREAAR